MEQTIRVSDFMKRFGFGRTKTYELLNSGQLESVKVDRVRLIKMRSALALIGEAA